MAARSYEDVWNRALQETKEILGEDDAELVDKFSSEAELLAEVQRLEQRWNKNSISRALNGIRPHIAHLQMFVAFLAISTGLRSITSACIWGLVGLMLQLAVGSHSDKALEEISEFLNGLGDKLEIFRIYKDSYKNDLEPELLDRFFEVLVQLLLACAATIKHFRKSNPNPLDHRNWLNIRYQLGKILQDLTIKIDHLGKLVKARKIVSIDSRQTDIIRELSKFTMVDKPREVELPCRSLPFDRNPAFFGRKETLLTIRQALKHDTNKCSIRSVALWGTAGIGKSQVALEYANMQMEAGCQVIIWIPSETEPEITSALMEAAKQLKPPGFEENMTPERTRFLMWDWLQRTDIPWLIIYDNVEDNDLLLQNWPSAGNGQIVVTCRSELLAASPAYEQVEILPFTVQESGQLLLNLANKRNSSDDELKAAEEIASLLDGLALALDVTARHILVKKKTVRQFVEYFKENRPALRQPPKYSPKNRYYSKNLDTVWQTAFMNLGDEAGKLLSLTCFFAPDGIPRELLNRKVPQAARWAFLGQLLAYEDAEAELLHNALIRVNIKDNTSTISLHRLIQEAYYDSLDSATRKDAYTVACALLCDAFPKRVHGRQLYQGWESCAALIPHVVTTQDEYSKMRDEGLDMQSEQYWTLLANAAWFCSETCSLERGDRIGRRAVEACADKNSLVFAYLCESVATVDHRRGRYASAYDYFKQALDIRQSESSTLPRVLADSYSAVGLALFGLFRSEEAIAAVDKAMALVGNAPKADQQTYNVDRYLRNRSRPKIALRRYKEAKQDVAEAEEFQTLVYGEKSHFHGETAYILGKLASIEGDQELAMKYLQVSYDLQSPGKPTHQSVASTLYHQALVCLQTAGDKAANDEKAASYLKRALKITLFNESQRGDKGESARVMWRLSQVLRRQGEVTKADEYETRARKAKADLEKTGLHPKAPDEEQSWDCFSDLVDR